MKIIIADSIVALGRFERTSDDARIFAKGFEAWRIGLGVHPLMYESNALNTAEIFHKITRETNEHLFRILCRTSSRKKQWVGNIMIAPLPRRQVTLSINVFDGWQRRGIATSALSLLVEMLKQESYKKICASVHPANKPSLKLFRRLDFKKKVTPGYSHPWLALEDCYLERDLRMSASAGLHA